MKQFLETVAPSDDVITWAATRARGDRTLIEQRRPTYYARALYLLDAKLPNDRMARNTAAMIADQISPMQSIKHGSLTGTRATVIMVLKTFEAFVSIALDPAS